MRIAQINQHLQAHSMSPNGKSIFNYVNCGTAHTIKGPDTAIGVISIILILAFADFSIGHQPMNIISIFKFMLCDAIRAQPAQPIEPTVSSSSSRLYRLHLQMLPFFDAHRERLLYNLRSNIDSIDDDDDSVMSNTHR